MAWLSEDNLILILVQALVKARKLKSGISGNDKPNIHVAMQGPRRVKEPVVVYSDTNAHLGTKHVSQLRSSVAVKHSSNNLAMSSHAVGHKLKGPEAALSHAGGVPLYKNGVLVGSVGISGDTPAVDEAIAHAAAEGFQAPVEIRSDRVLNIPYHSGSILESSETETKVQTPRSRLAAKLSPRSTKLSGKNARRSSGRLESPLTTSLPPLPSSVSMASLPPLPVVSSPPTPSSLPPLPSTPRLTLSSSGISSSPRVQLPPSPRVQLPPSPRAQLPPSPSQIGSSFLPSSKVGSSMSSLSPSSFSSSVKLPVLPPSPQSFKTTSSLPPLSRLTALK